MTIGDTYFAIYDFEILPYALGDVLTWNVQTSLRCEEAGREKVDVLVLNDPRYPSSIYQRDLVFAENAPLFFNELLGAFGTHPRLGNIHIFTKREELLAFVEKAAAGDTETQGILDDYNRVIAGRENADVLNEYFIKYIYSHGRINEFSEKHGRIPLLQPSQGCEPDVDNILANALGDKKVVVIHPRLRRLDAGLKGEHIHFRDSDFLIWYEFLHQAIEKYPDVQFVVVGRMQEKPIALLRLPNVTNLRTMGLGLGHELTLMLKSDLFIGTSSGFAALANFSLLPYFVTKMNKESYNAYGIPEGTEKLPFATDQQKLIRATETVEMLNGLLEDGLKNAVREITAPSARSAELSGKNFAREQSNGLVNFATTSRFFIDDLQADQEIAALVESRVTQAIEAAAAGDLATARRMYDRLVGLFPQLVGRHKELDFLRDAKKSPVRKAGHNLRHALEPVTSVIDKVKRSLARGTFSEDVSRKLSQIAGRQKS
jgi:hypothetical protein